jgi:hypothetical protein
MLSSESVSDIAINNCVLNDIKGNQINYYNHGKAKKLRDPRSEHSDLHPIAGSHDDRLKIAAWISPLNFKATQLDMFQKRAPNTGQWLLNSSEFNAWLVGSSETLWSPGIREIPLPG